MIDRKREQLVEQLRAALDREARDIDELTLAGLRAARRRAVARAESRARSGSRSWLTPGVWWLPAGAIASVVATVLGLSVLLNRPVDESVHRLDDLELLGSAGDLELYENLEFYRWLQQTGATG